MINKNIVGYELVKNVTKCSGVEHGIQDMLFVIRRDCGGDYLTGLVEVRENTQENYNAIRVKYPRWNDDYILWWGTVFRYSKIGGEDEIVFHWS